MPYRIGLVTMNPFPVGNVATLRYSSYCQALHNNGCFVKVYIPAPSKAALPNLKYAGSEGGVCYEYMYRRIGWKRRPNVVVALTAYFFGLIKVLYKLRLDRINLIVFYGNDFLSYFLLRIFSSACSVPLITDKSEYPYGYHLMGPSLRFVERLKLKLFDGFIVMTDELSVFYGSVKRKTATIFKLPITVDHRKFNPIDPWKRDKVITCVFGIHNRDCLEDTVMAFYLYRKAIGNDAYTLRLFGDFWGLPNSSEIYGNIVQLGLKDYVELAGVIPSSSVPDMLARSSCLITTPRSYYSGGFPAKLAEYLLSGVPVVATSAGEIGRFLKDGENSMLVNPGDVEEVSAKLCYLTENPSEAVRIGQNGRALAMTDFSIDSYISSLMDFMGKLISSSQ